VYLRWLKSCGSRMEPSVLIPTQPTRPDRTAWRCPLCNAYYEDVDGFGELLIRCRRCKGKGLPNKRKPVPQWERPPMLRRFADWRLAMQRWKAAGKPERSEKEVERIVNEHCEPCVYYHSRQRQCKLCGCLCRQKGRAEFNKPKMLTERCPLEPPKWGEDCIVVNED
jgi:hypothetical protein